MYKIFLLHSGRKDLDAFERKIVLQINAKLSALAKNPGMQGCQKLTDEEGYRFRSGDCRILYRIADSNKSIYVYKIKHCKDVYR